MAVQNTLTKAKSGNTSIVEYESGGQMVKLSAGMIRQYLVSGGGNVTDQEVMMFLSLCKFQHLNPFLHEAYLIKFGNSPATMVVGKDVFIKRARRSPDYIGKQAGVIVLDESGNLIEREGTLVLKSERLVGGWCKVFIRGYDTPEYASVSFDEYAGRKSNGELNNQWATKPATMIRKVAIVHALRDAFPEETAGMLAAEEMADAAGVVMAESAANEVPIQIPAEETEKPAEVPAAESVSEALFS